MKTNILIMALAFVALAATAQRQETQIDKYADLIGTTKARVYEVTENGATHYQLALLAKDPSYTAIAVYEGAVLSGEAAKVFIQQLREAVAIKKAGSTVTTWSGPGYLMSRQGSAIVLSEAHRGVILMRPAAKALALFEKYEDKF